MLTITISGPKAAGKTVAMSHIAAHLKQLGYSVRAFEGGEPDTLEIGCGKSALGDVATELLGRPSNLEPVSDSREVEIRTQLVPFESASDLAAELIKHLRDRYGRDLQDDPQD